VKTDNVKDVIDAGVNIIVSGSGLFSGDMASNIATMKSHG
jgi:pentose-5-phosphate-3-epimerase